jgi:hypothetical protein
VIGSPPQTISFLTPTYRPAGGVVKIFDYVVHGLELGYRARVHCPVELTGDELLFKIPRFSRLHEQTTVTFHDSLNVGVGPEDWVVFSWPSHYEQIARGMSPDAPHERVIHLVQNTRHANPTFAEGYATRLLARPMARVMVAHEVMDACRPHLNQESSTVTIVEAHDWRFFHRTRTGGLSNPVRVGYTTWKSEVGLEVEQLMGDSFEFRSLTGPASWLQIRELLHWCDVFLCCPGPEEGFYLPGLEAFAAGAIVITPDVGGNRAYCRFGENCIAVGLDRPDEYASALASLAQAPDGDVQRLRDQGYAVLEHHLLARERAAFGAFLVDLAGRTKRLRWA